MEDRHKQKLSYPLRMPDELRAKLEGEASKIGRSLHAEIIHRLEQSFLTPKVGGGDHENILSILDKDAIKAIKNSLERYEKILANKD